LFTAQIFGPLLAPSNFSNEMRYAHGIYCLTS